MNIVEEVLAGSKRALARAITAVENEYDEAAAIMQQLYPHTGRAQVIGITGPRGQAKAHLLINWLKNTAGRVKRWELLLLTQLVLFPAVLF